MKIIPKGEWILCQRVKVERKSIIQLADIEGENKDGYKNIVIAVGEKVKKYKVGDDVIPWPMRSIGLDYRLRGIDNDLIIVEEKNIIALFQEK